MRNFVIDQIDRRSAAISILLGLALVGRGISQETEKQKREPIGEVLGKPVYRDEIRTGNQISRKDELHRLFSGPVMQEYRRVHKAEIEPTKEELDSAATFFDRNHQERIKDEAPKLREQLTAVEKELMQAGITKEKQRKLELERQVLRGRLKPPGRAVAVIILENWKFQRHLYDKFGGGRILWQQAGMEAFDATRKWLEAQEKNGAFKITDENLRLAFYEYWTTQNHGSFLTDDRERIRTEFLEPAWMQSTASEN